MEMERLAIRMACAVLAIIAFSAASTMHAADVDPLQELRWSNRVLLIFADSMTDANAQSMQTSAGASADGLVDRDLVLGWVLSQEQSRLGERALSKDYAARLRARVGSCADAFCVVLLGKDGGIKARYRNVPDMEEVFSLIDGMPMRRREMRQ